MIDVHKSTPLIDMESKQDLFYRFKQHIFHWYLQVMWPMLLHWSKKLLLSSHYPKRFIWAWRKRVLKDSCVHGLTSMSMYCCRVQFDYTVRCSRSYSQSIPNKCKWKCPVCDLVNVAILAIQLLLNIYAKTRLHSEYCL